MQNTLQHFQGSSDLNIGVARILFGGALFGEKVDNLILVVTLERRSKCLILYLQI